MTAPNVIKIDDIEYVKKSNIPGNRAVIVIDRGWIFAGDIVRENGRIKISNAVHVFSWNSIGFAKMVETEKADLRPILDVEIPESSEIFCIPVHEKWGLK